MMMMMLTMMMVMTTKHEVETYAHRSGVRTSTIVCIPAATMKAVPAKNIPKPRRCNGLKRKVYIIISAQQAKRLFIQPPYVHLA